MNSDEHPSPLLLLLSRGPGVLIPSLISTLERPLEHYGAPALVAKGIFVCLPLHDIYFLFLPLADSVERKMSLQLSVVTPT